MKQNRKLNLTLAGVMVLFGSSVAQAKLIANLLSPAKLTAAKPAAAKLSSSKLAATELAPNRFAANPRGVTDLMATSDGREVLSFIVSCALPDGTTLVAKDADNIDHEFFGEIGLAPSWLDRLRALIFSEVKTHENFANRRSASPKSPQCIFSGSVSFLDKHFV